MPLHLLKLSVGTETIADLESWVAERQTAKKKRGEALEHIHTTRMAPKRTTELLDGGSLYWVIKGQLCARQTLLDIRPIVDSDGISRVNLVMEPVVIPVMPRPFRPFQGWRYLQAKDAPPDLGRGTSAVADMPEDMRRQLSELGLL